MHFSELRFLEIGGDPDVFGLADNQQLLAGFDALADLDGFAGDDAGSGRIDFGVGEIECGLVDFRKRRTSTVGFAGFGGCLANRDVARRILL